MVTNLSSSQLSTRDERVYEDLVPDSFRWEHQNRVSLFYSLLGFEEEHVVVQQTTSNVLTITAEHPLDYDNKWIRFQRHIRFRAICNVADYRAGYGKLNFIIKVPKLIPLVTTKEEDLDAEDHSSKAAASDSAEETSVVPAATVASPPVEATTRVPTPPTTIVSPATPIAMAAREIVSKPITPPAVVADKSSKGTGSRPTPAPRRPSIVFEIWLNQTNQVELVLGWTDQPVWY
ncbi:unnamed protein product [Linum trigynum]|uniref:SHSP domain-containing protein n=1 Tax=Linum trigynum TaxID=586398 RepID=A0AAV2GD24_9ROSI